MITQSHLLTDTHDQPALPHLPPPAENRPLIVPSEDLLQGRRELWIEHGEEMYRLRLTRAGKLYLTK